MNRSMQTLLTGMRRAAGASRPDIAAASQAMGFDFPADYVDLMMMTNGAEGAIGDDGYLVIWPIEEIVMLNETSEVAEFAPGLVLFGSDGGNTQFAFDRRAAETRIVSIPLDVLDLRYVKGYGENLQEWLTLLSAERDD